MILLQSIIGFLSSPLLLEFLKHLSSAFNVLNMIFNKAVEVPQVFVSHVV